MRFTKMQGLGNDYVYLDCTKEIPHGLPELARKISDRHFGVGSDGLICVCLSDRADFRMRMFNADGSEGEMCGNGIRCVGKFVYDKRLTEKTSISIETLAGIKYLRLEVTHGRVSSVIVDMGIPRPEEIREILVAEKAYSICPVSMGNPHAVIFLDGIDTLDLASIGPGFETHPSFPNRTNTEFIEVINPHLLKMRVWERGSGETLACGTGACAALVAAVLEGKADRTATVRLLGGDLLIRWNKKDGHVYMAGPAVTVFEGEWKEKE